MPQKRKLKPNRRASGPKYWHGGVSGLHVGQRITSPASRGKTSWGTEVGASQDEYSADENRVYITTDRAYAVLRITANRARQHPG